MSGRRYFYGYHRVWLTAHPHRSEDWLRAMLRDGFDVHHRDGDHFNDHPDNLFLIERSDHMRLHGMFGLAFLTKGCADRRAWIEERRRIRKIEEQENIRAEKARIRAEIEQAKDDVKLRTRLARSVKAELDRAKKAEAEALVLEKIRIGVENRAKEKAAMAEARRKKREERARNKRITKELIQATG